MNKDWRLVRNILCIRPDNMGDVIMTQPALRALKESQQEVHITLLTSDIGANITPYIPEIDKTIAYNVPWVKASGTDVPQLSSLIQTLSKEQFDAAVIFTNFSQSAHPSAAISLLAHIPKRLAYSRERVYDLLTDWVADTEPFTPLIHGVERNLKLVATIGATTINTNLSLKILSEDFQNLLTLLFQTSLDLTKPWVIIHPGVEDKKRQFPVGRLAEVARLLIHKGYQILLTGTQKEEQQIHHMQQLLQKRAINLGGKLSLGEFLGLLRISPLVIANNTGVVHMAAALNTPVIVLYARTNPEHTPWNVKSYVFYFDTSSSLKSKVPLLSYIAPHDQIPLPKAMEILEAALAILASYTHSPNFQFL